MSKAVEVEDLYFTYLGSRRPSLRGVSFTLDEGETLLIVGPSGAGKSTLIMTLNGVIPSVVAGKLKGSVKVFGKNPAEEGVAEMAKYVAYVFQDPESQIVAFTVEEEVAFGPENLLVPPSEIGERISEALKVVELEAKRHAPTDSLSLGEKQRVAAAAALAMKPRLLILDEPTSHLDPASARRFYRYIASLKKKATLIIVEHRIDYVYRLVDKVLYLDDGEAKFYGKPEEFFSEISMEQLLDKGIWVPESLLIRSRLSRVDLAASLRKQGSEVESKVREIAVAVESLHFRYDGGFELVDVDFEARRGDVTCIVGPNGSGKTTLLKLVAGILKPQEGKITVLGGKPSLSNVAFVMQNPEYQFVARRVVEDVAASYVAKGLSRNEALKKAYRDLELAGLSHVAECSPFELSQGQKRIVSILSVLALDRELILMDEPTYGLDRRYSVKVAQQAESMAREGKAVLLVTHDTWLVPLICDRLIALREGRVVYAGSLKGFLERGDLLAETAFAAPPGLAELVQMCGDVGLALKVYRRIMGAVDGSVL